MINKSPGRLGKLREWLPPMALAVTIFMVSGRSQVAAPNITGIDKVAHFAVFGLLGTLVARVSGVASWRGLGVWWAVVIVSGYGIADEWHQSFTPGRSVELADWLVDTAGAALAVFIYARWTAYRSILEKQLARSRIEISTTAAPNTAP